MIWIVSTFILVSVAQAVFFPEFRLTPSEQVVSQDIMTTAPADASQNAQASGQSEEMSELRDALGTLKNINFAVIILTFLFYFIGGYLLYASLFAAVGAAVDSETDTQQFVFPILLPLILGIIVLFSITNNPDSPISFWFSIIPFTSPIVMMARIPFGVPWAEFFLSAGLLVAFFIGSTWLAGKIYRTGILMYGKKATFREMLKWITYKT
jgi:ABC-2 type transport system permease protein